MVFGHLVLGLIFDILDLPQKCTQIAFFSSKTCVYRKIVVLLRRKTQNNTIMVATQPTFNQVYDMAAMLTWQDQRKLVQEVQRNIRQYEEISPITKDELLASVEHADALIDEDHYIEHDAAKQHFQSRMAQKKEWV